MNKKELNIFLLIPNILFVVYWAILLYFNRFSQDDYGFMAQIRNIDPISFVSGVYNNFSGRFVRYFIYWVKYRILNTMFFPWLYPTFIYVITILSIAFVCKKTKLDEKVTLLGILCYNLLIFCNMEFCAFFWTAAVDYYATAFLYPLWLFYFCFVCKHRIVGPLGVVLCSLLIGGGCEAHSPLFLYAIFCFAMYCIFSHRKIDNAVWSKLILAFVLITIGFLIVCLAPGSSGRIAMYTEKPTISGMLVQSIKSLAALLYLLAFRVPFFAILFVLAYCSGKMSVVKKEFNIRPCLYSCVCLLGMMWISTFPAAYGMGGLGFQRIYTPEVAASLIFCAVWGYRFGQSRKGENRCMAPACITSTLVCVSLVGHIIIDTPTAKNYHDSDKARIERCLAEKEAGRTEELVLESLPSCATYNVKSVIMGNLFGDDKKPILFYGNSICSKSAKLNSEDPDVSFGNDCMIGFYQLPFYIYNEENDE